MDEPRQQQAGTSAQQNFARRKRERQVSNWLAFIRPHVDRYRGLPRGKQRQYVEKLSEKTGSKINTLRRYIAAAQVLEAHGITEFPSGLKRLPVAAVEAIERISKKDPARGRELFVQLIQGRRSIRELKDKLADMPCRVRPTRRMPKLPRIGIDQLLAEVEALAGDAARPKDGGSSNLRLIRFIDSKQHGSALLGRAALPWFVALPPAGGGHVVVFDESTSRWAASPAFVVREFLCNIVMATAMFDWVIVLCSQFRREIEHEVATLRDDCRRRVRVLEATMEQLDVKWQSAKR